MIYKFENENRLEFMEVSQSNFRGNKVIIRIDDNEHSMQIALNQQQLYDLIGALHSIQTKIKKEVSNG